MANLVLPANPNNGDQVTHEGTTFTYVSLKDVWTREMLQSKVEDDLIPSSDTSLASTAISGSNLVFTSADGSTSNVSLNAIASGQVKVFATEADLPSSGIQAGDHAFVTATNDLYIYAGGWRSIDSVNLTPTISASISSHNFGTIGESIDITYTTSEPEGTPVTVTTSNTNITNTSQVDISHHTSNNTVTVVSGANELSGGTLTISVTDGTNIGTATITLDVTYVVSFATYNTTLLDPTQNVSNTFGQFYFGSQAVVSNNGLVVYVGAPRYNGTKGGIFMYENTSGDTANNTSWTYRSVFTPTSYTGSGQTSANLDTTNAYFGGMSAGSSRIRTSSDGNILVAPYNHSTNGVTNASYRWMIIVERNGTTGFVNHSSFNTYFAADPGNTIAGSNPYQYMGSIAENFDISSDVSRIAYYFPTKHSGGQKYGHIIIAKRTGSDWAFEASFNADQLNGVNGLFNQFSDPAGGTFGDLVMSGAGDKVVFSSVNGMGSNKGAVYTITRSGTTWSQVFLHNDVWHSGSTGNLHSAYNGGNTPSLYGKRIAMTRDGQYLAVTEMGYIGGAGASSAGTRAGQYGGQNSAHNHAKIWIYKWANSQWEPHSDINMNISPQWAPLNPDPGDNEEVLSLEFNDSGTQLYCFVPYGDGIHSGYNSQYVNTGNIVLFKRSGTTWSHDKNIYLNTEFGLNHHGNPSSTTGHEKYNISGDGKVLIAGNYNHIKPNDTGSWGKVGIFQAS